jgi:hypothetical protein
VIVAVTVFDEVLITEIVPLVILATYTFVPSGVIAMPQGSVPTVIGVPAVIVAKVMGVTVPDE